LCRQYQEGGAAAECTKTYDEDTPEPYLGCRGTLECVEKDGKSTCTAPPPAAGTKAVGADCKKPDDCVTNRCFQGKCFTDKMGISPDACANPVK
jgi:hypothetical protein